MMTAIHRFYGKISHAVRGAWVFFIIVLLSLCVLVPVGGAAGDEGWRLRIREAAVTQGDTVLLGDIAEPFGPISEMEWQKLAERPLWAAPREAGKPMQINKVRLVQALRERLGDVADRCLMPSGLAIQRGGAVLYEQDLSSLVVKTLTPTLNTLPGRHEITDFRLPAYIFLAHSGQEVKVEPVKPSPGRLSLRFQVAEVDGSIARRFTGSAFINVWTDVACAGAPYNRGDTITPEGITWMNKNLAYMKGEVWDGRGGPWQAVRPLGTGQPIYATDIEPKSAIRRGDIINLVYSKGRIRVTVQADAMADAGLGDNVTVRNLQSRKQVFGTVHDNSTVVVR